MGAVLQELAAQIQHFVAGFVVNFRTEQLTGKGYDLPGDGAEPRLGVKQANVLGQAQQWV